MSFPSAGTAAFGYGYAYQAGQFEPFKTTNQGNLGLASGSQTTCIVYQAQTAPTTPAGSYATTVIYTAVPYF